MENPCAETKKLPSTASAERCDNSAIHGREGGENFGPPCAGPNDQICPIINCLRKFNELLFEIGMQLREQTGGSLSLVCFEPYEVYLLPPTGARLYQANTFLRWLLKTHVCITSLELVDVEVKWNSRIFLEELSDNCRLKKLTLKFYKDDTVKTCIYALLPKLRGLEELSCICEGSMMYVLEDALSALLRNTTCLTSLLLDARVRSGRLRKALIDALSANSTLKTLELFTNWTTAEPSEEAREYIRNNGLLTSLTVSGSELDRQDLLLVECLVRNDTLSALYVSNLCGGERTARFLTRILSECAALKKLTVGSVQDPYISIPEAAMTLCAEAMARNEALRELELPYSLWHQKNWIAFFSFLPRNGCLKKLDVTHGERTDYETFPAVLEALEQTNTSVRVSFGHCTSASGAHLMHYKVFSSLRLSGEESVQVCALQKLRALDHFTRLSVDVSKADEHLFSSLANYIRGTTALQDLELTVTRPQGSVNAVCSSCWITLFQSISANTSIAELEIFSSGSFAYNDHLVRTVALSKTITRVSLFLNIRNGQATDFISLLASAIIDSFCVLEVLLYGAKVDAEAVCSLFAVRETTRRNCGLVVRAVDMIDRTTPLDWYTAVTLEKVSRHPALVREVAKKKDIAVEDVTRILRTRLESVQGLHGFMRITGVVKNYVTCAPPVHGSSTQLEHLNSDCWRLLRRYLSIDDVKPSPSASREALRASQTTTSEE
ncbi:hypothetical protein HPB50_019421 [Hyalomma asiaticum]|uniref:Uncharacterized protein n=1 Tax=Hyalomma asiaticum TaxID=266040 RepID=A0ACB7TBC3_HYAAI|nr:hypothetical protein HPB50_019421 [Hyalomma asiaticum]